MPNWIPGGNGDYWFDQCRVFHGVLHQRWGSRAWWPQRLTEGLNSMRSCGIPARLLDIWLSAQASLTRWWLLNGQLFHAGPATAGFPEGDQWSVLAMICLSVAWIYFVRSLVADPHGLRLSAFADNWSWTVVLPADHAPFLSGICRFATTAGVALDWTKTWYWTIQKSLDALVREHLTSVASGPVHQRTSAPDLGFQMQYMGSATTLGFWLSDSALDLTGWVVLPLWNTHSLLRSTCWSPVCILLPCMARRLNLPPVICFISSVLRLPEPCLEMLSLCYHPLRSFLVPMVSLILRIGSFVACLPLCAVWLRPCSGFLSPCCSLYRLPASSPWSSSCPWILSAFPWLAIHIHGYLTCRCLPVGWLHHC